MVQTTAPLFFSLFLIKVDVLVNVLLCLRCVDAVDGSVEQIQIISDFRQTQVGYIFKSMIVKREGKGGSLILTGDFHETAQTLWQDVFD